MRGLTHKERREIRKELKQFNRDKLRLVIDCYSHGEELYLLGINAMDTELCLRLCIPFKNVPDLEKIRQQLERTAPEVFIREDC